MQQSVEIDALCGIFFCYCHHTFHENSSFTGKAELIIRLKNSYLNIFNHLSAAEDKTAALAPIAAASFFCNGQRAGKKDTAESGKKLRICVISDDWQPIAFDIFDH